MLSRAAVRRFEVNCAGRYDVQCQFLAWFQQWRCVVKLWRGQRSCGGKCQTDAAFVRAVGVAREKAKQTCESESARSIDSAALEP